MSNILVITFDDEEQALSVLKSLKSLEHMDQISITDTAVIVKDKSGKVQVKNATESGVKIGAVTGGFFGLLIGSLLFPVAGVLIGAAGGAALGKMFETGVDKNFVKEVRDSLTPGSSAILFVVGGGNVGLLVTALEPYSGKVYQSTFNSEVQASIEQALKVNPCVYERRPGWIISLDRHPLTNPYAPGKTLQQPLKVFLQQVTCVSCFSPRQ